MLASITTLWVVLGIAAVTVLCFIAIYNSLVSRRIRCREAWSQVDVQLKRRHDLIPHLVETVRGNASHEQETLDLVMQARGAAMAAGDVKERAEAENMLSGTLRQILALSENCPDLKANENFARLREELTSTENRIAFSCRHYNDSSAIYNTARQKFPGNIVAGMFNLQPQDFFELEDPAAAQPSPPSSSGGPDALVSM